jgi:Na+/alanine symporter
MMDTRDAFNNLNPIALFGGCILPIIATPLGIVVAYVVRRIMPIANILIATILAGYIITVVILFVVLRQLLPETVLNIFATATISLIAAAGIIFFLAFFIYRKLFAHETERKAALKEDQAFAVFGEDVRDKSSYSRRSKK